MPVIVRSNRNANQTLDGVTIPPFAQRTLPGAVLSTAVQVAMTARLVSAVLVPDASAAGANDISVYTYTPATGAVQQIPDDAEEIHVEHAATIAAYTLHMPANPYANQIVGFTFKSIVTALTLDTSGATVAATIQGNLTAAVAGGFARFRYDAVNAVWRRIG